MDDVNLQIIFLAVLIMFSAYFSATETSFSTLNKIKLKNEAQSGNARAKKVLELYNKYDKLLSTILIGNNIVNILATSVATALFVSFFPKNGVAISTVVMATVVLTFGEILPKSIAKEMPEKFAKFSAPMISVFLLLLTPLNLFFSALKTAVKKMLKITNDSSITDRELLTMVEEAQNDGGIDEAEGDLLISAIEFYDLEVSDILTPRVDVAAVDIEDSAEEIRETFRKSGFSRLPVYKDTIDNIIGILNEKDFYYSNNIKDIVCPAVFVHDSMKISKLMTILKDKKSHLAVVTDEYGGTVGVVSLEDILEELVGEIWDEHDMVKEEFLELSPNRYIVRGSANLEDMFENFDLELDEEIESTSVSGWIAEISGRIPKKGERLDFDGFTVLITKTEQNRIIEAMITKKIAPEQKEQ